MSLMKPPIVQRGYDKADLLPVKRYAVMAERESVSRHRQPLHAPHFASIEMNQGLLKQMPIQKAAPLSETSLRCFGQQSTSVRDGFPSTAIDLSGKTVCSAKGASSQLAVDFHSTEVQELDSIRLHQCPVVIDLGIVSSAKPFHRLQLVDHALDDQIQSVNLLKSSERNRDRHLGMHIAEALGTQSCSQIVLINRFFTKTAQFVLRGISTTHHNLIKLVKLCVRQKPDRGVVKNRHSRQKWTKHLQFGKSDEGHRNGDKGIRARNSFPCPHSLVLILLFPLLALAEPPQATLETKHRAFLKDNCLTCHNAEKQKGKVRLDDIAFTLDSVEKADLWQKVLNSINSGEMPPEDEKQPAPASKTDFLDDLSRTLVTARTALSDSGGKITMRRLNRREYKNTIRDLLGVDLRVNELPADGGAGTFDTVGSSLFMSSDQFEQYLALGRQALDEHFARFVMPTTIKPRLMHVEAEERNARIAVSLKERTDAHERYEKWTAAVNAAAAKPENADIVAQIRAEKKGNETHLFFAWQRIQGAPSPSDFGFTDAVHADEQGRRNWVHSVPQQRAYLAHPAAKTGSFLTIEDVFANPYQPFRIPGDWAAGDYVVRVRIAATSNTPKERHFVEFGSQHDTGVRAVTSSHQVTGTMEKPQVIEIPLKFSPANGHGFFFQEKGSYESEEVAHRLFAEAKKRNGIGPEFALWIDWIEVASAGAAPVATKVEKLRKDPEQWANKYMPIYAEGYVEKYSRFQKWCAAIDEAAKQPANADIVKKLRDDPKVKQSPHLFYSRFAEIKDAPPPTQFGFKDVDDAQFARSEFTYHHQYYLDYAKLPARDTGTWLMLYSLGRYTGIAAPDKWPAGRYTLRVRLAASDESPKERRFIEIGRGKADAADFNVLSSHQVTGTLANPQTLEIPVEINASGDRNFAIRDKRPNTREAEYAMFREAWDETGTGPRPCIWVDFVELEGTLGTNPIAAKTIKERREVELHANAIVGGTYNGYFKGGYEAAKKFMETKQPQKGIPDEQEAKFRIRGFEQNGPTFERYLNDPLTKTGAYLTIYNVHKEEVITLPPDQPSGWLKTKHEVEKAEPGDYLLRFRIGAVKGTPKERHFVALGSRKAGDEDFTLMQTFQISGTTDAPQIIEVPVSLAADGPRTFVLREKRDVKLDHELFTTAQKATGVGPPSALWIDWVEWEGPLVKQAPIAKVERIEPEKRRADVERGHLRFKYLNEQYAKWKAAGGDEKRLKEFDFTDKSHAEFAKVVWDSNNRWFQQYLDRPLSKTGLYLDNTVQETCEHAIDLPADLATGDYIMRVKIGRVPDMPTERAFLSFVEASPIDKDDRTFLANKQITATLDQPEIIELPFQIRPGGPRKFILMEKRPLKKEAISLPGRTRQITDAKQRDPVLWIDWIEWQGPLNKAETSSQVQPVIAAGETNPRSVLETFAERAFRGKKPSAAFFDKLSVLYDVRRKAGDAHETALKEPLSVILASPGFLYLQEIGSPSFTPNLLPADQDGKKLRVKDQKQNQLSQAELASRLSYFLWSAPPDDALLKAELTKPDILAREVDRLIASPKADEFVSGFVHQWLGMDRLDFFQFDTKQFRDFDESAKAAARREVYETFAHLLRNNGSLTKLLKSDEIHVNGLLATYYGIEGISGDAFQKVKLPANSPRGGLLGMAAILAMGSNGERTSPVERGAWVLRKLLHNPPPPAPPNVPQITRLENKLLNTRERLLAHQEEPQCLQCHRKIDFIGFGLENFNAAGKWRTEETFEKRGVGKKTWPIDPSGQFYNGPAFQDYFQLRNLIAAKSEDFARGFTEALIEYALGRPYGFTDAALADDIVKRAKAKGFVMKEFFVALASSKEFRSK